MMEKIKSETVHSLWAEFQVLFERYEALIGGKATCSCMGSFLANICFDIAPDREHVRSLFEKSLKMAWEARENPIADEKEDS